MGTRETKRGEERYDSDDPPPVGDICFINDLSPELLCRIFELCYTRLRGMHSERDACVLMLYGGGYAEWARQLWGNADVEGPSGSGSEVESIDDAGNSRRVGPRPYGPYPPFPIIISYVCRYWRDVALSTSSLWSDFEVYPIKDQSFKQEKLTLERSQDMPIDVRIDCRFHEYSRRFHQYIGHIEPPSGVELVLPFRMLASHVHRWRTMIVDAAELYDVMYAFLKAASDSTIPAAAQLETLELYHHGAVTEFGSFPYPNMMKPLTLFGGSAPSLTKLTLWGVHVDWNQPWITSASNLQSLVLAWHAGDVRPSWAQFATILRGASALQELALYQSGPSGDPAWWFFAPTDLNAPVVLAGVTRFSLLGSSQPRAIALFRKLCFPALKYLSLRFKQADYTDLIHELAGPATPSSPSSAHDKMPSLLSGLDALDIVELPCSAEAIETLYGELDDLKSLTLCMSELDPQFLDILATRRASPGRDDVWLPRLSHLSADGAPLAAIRSVIERRRDAGVPAAVVFEGSDDEDQFEEGEWTDIDEENEESAWTDVDEDEWTEGMRTSGRLKM